ncbi:MAG: hypothetical protein LBL78_02960 [Prevotellaceae bacterium]|jgi:hypothetical protein|nr:hypothetical protein [Prevotellaceae bacterium]
MKNLMKSLCVVAVALAAGMFTSCSNDEEQISTSEGQKVTLKINMPTMAQSRFVEAPVKGGDALTLSKVAVVFTNPGGTVTAKFAAPGDYTIAELNAGVTVTVPGTSTKVYAVANTTVTPEVGINFQDYVSDVTKLAAGSQSGADAINIYGVADLKTPDTPISGVDKVAKDTIATTVARFEVTDLTAAGEFESFDVRGIYMDGFYENASIDGTSGTLKALTTVGDNIGTDYQAGWSGAIFNEGKWTSAAPAAGTSTEQVATAGTGNVWGYYVFAKPYYGKDGFDFTSKTAGSAVPTIIIKVDNVKLKDDASQTDKDYYEGHTWYVTAKSFTLAGDGSNIESIVGGYVIKTAAGAFKVSEKTVTPDPNTKDIKVDVSVTPIVWKGIEVIPNV